MLLMFCVGYGGVFGKIKRKRKYCKEHFREDHEWHSQAGFEGVMCVEGFFFFYNECGDTNDQRLPLLREVCHTGREY